jgi:hypothetical protein
MPAATWILTASPENHAETARRDFGVIGIKERNRKRAELIEPGDRIVLYLTREMSFAGSIRVAGSMFEDREPIWPGKPGSPDPYPWRFATKPEWIPASDRRISAESLRTELAHVRKWPPEHWRLAFQGQIREVCDDDANLLVGHLKAAANG